MVVGATGLIKWVSLQNNGVRGKTAVAECVGNSVLRCAQTKERTWRQKASWRRCVVLTTRCFHIKGAPSLCWHVNTLHACVVLNALTIEQKGTLSDSNQ